MISCGKSIRIVVFKELEEAVGLLPGSAGWQSFLEVMKPHEQKIWVAAADLPCGMLEVSSLRPRTILPMFILKSLLEVSRWLYIWGVNYILMCAEELITNLFLPIPFIWKKLFF